METNATIIYLPTPKELTPEQREHWLDQVDYWSEREEISQTALEYAQRRREDALRMLGFLAIERGLEG